MKYSEEQKEQVRDLSRIGATYEEISLVSKIPRRRLEMWFKEEIEEGRAHLRTSVRRRQLQILNQDRDLKAANVAGIFLGKNILGQTDRTESTTFIHDNATKDSVKKAIQDQFGIEPKILKLEPKAKTG